MHGSLGRKFYDRGATGLNRLRPQAENKMGAELLTLNAKQIAFETIKRFVLIKI